MDSGPPLLVFAHYFGGSARSWMPLVTELGDGFKRVVPDLPGFGDTAPPVGEQSLSRYAEDFVGLASHAPWIAVGHSMGGKIALAAALRHPPGLRALVLLAPSPPTPEPIADHDRASSLKSFGSRAAAERRIAAIANHTLPLPLVAACVEDQLRVDRTAWRWWLERGSRDDISRDTILLEMPVLVVTGDKDSVLGSGVAPAVAAGLRNARLEVVAGGGHLVPLEWPKTVAAAIRRFIATLSHP